MEHTWKVLIVSLVLLSVIEAKRVRLRDVQTLTLTAGKMTTARRNSPIDQLHCVGGYCSRARIPSAQCYNRGFDGVDVQWECKAEMPANYKFGRIEVSCEGYDYPEDDYILAGSCGLEYTIDEISPSSRSSSSYYSENKYDHLSDTKTGSWFPVLMMAAFIFIIYWTCLRSDQPASASRSTGDFYDSPGWGSGASAPPPPGFRSDYCSPDSSCGQSRGSNSSSSSGPGFLSGIAAGGLLGYLFGSGGSRSYSRQRYGNDYWDTPSTSGFSSSSFSDPGPSTSTAFGGTRRR